MQEIEDILDISVESPSVSMEAIMYDVFFRQKGIRRMSQLASPIISEISNTVLPKFSIYHYNPESPLLFGPTENNQWYIADRNLRFIQHVTEFNQQPIGSIMKRPGSLNAYISAYRRKHRTLRQLRDFFGVNRSGNMLMVVNYCLLNQLWRYRPHRMVNYYKFFNMYSTITGYMDKLATQSDRQQYFEVRLPQVLPSRAIYRNLSKEYEKGINNKHLKFFKEDDDWLLFHLWLWVGKQEHLSIFNKIQTKHLDKINLLITDQGKYCVINLGLLNKWRSLVIDGYDDEGNLVSDLETDIQSTERLQVRFYKLLEMFVSTRTGNGVRQIDIPKYTEDELKEENESDENDDEILEEAQEVTTGPEPSTKPPKSLPEKILDEVDTLVTGERKQEETPDKPKGKNKLKPIPQTTSDGEVKEEEEPIVDDSDTQIIVEEDPIDDVISEPEEPAVDEVETEQDPLVASILEDAMELVEGGAMTVKQYQRLKEKAQAYKTATSPYFVEETVEQTINVPQEVVTSFEKRKVPDNPWIIDKSMLEVTTEEAQKQYLEKVYKRNIIQSIMNVQKGGILVESIERDEVLDDGNHYEILKVKVTPVENGSTTTVNIKLPVIDPETGYFKYNNSTYMMKKMRRDK